MGTGYVNIYMAADKPIHEAKQLPSPDIFSESQPSKQLDIDSKIDNPVVLADHNSSIEYYMGGCYWLTLLCLQPWKKENWWCYTNEIPKNLM